MRYFTLLALLLGYFNSFGQLTVTTTTTDVSCFAGNDGSATATPTGGTPPYTFVWNTVPVQTTDSVYGLAAGSYNVTVTDSNGITAQEVVYIIEPMPISLWTTNTNVSCNGATDASATAYVTGGTSPYTYSWNDPLNQQTSTANYLSGGQYNDTITDANGCVSLDSVWIFEPPLLTSTMTSINDTCGLCIGSAHVFPNGGSPPYAYTWSNANVTQVSTGLCMGTYLCTVTDTNNCTLVDTATIGMAYGPICQLGTINGVVYKDVNGNCNQDTLEQGMGNIMLVANPGPYYFSTNANGEYAMTLPFGNYTITQVLPQYYNEICPVSGSYAATIDSLNHTITNINFADTVANIQEVSVLLSSGTPRPGFVFSYYLNYRSIGNIPMNGMISLVTDNLLSFTNASITPDIISGDTLFWNYSNLQMFENRGISVSFYVPASPSLLGDTLRACAQITPLVGDADASNNTNCNSRLIVGSYDPNDKQVSPKGVGASGDILPTETELTYTIQFQNSGTDTAFNVVVVDTLSANLNVASLRKVMASHPFTYGVSGEGVLTFTFNNILLPDSNVNEPASHGLIQFTIDQNSSNTVGTEIKNTAEIYFDFNPAIVTNTVLNTVSLLTNVSEVKIENGIAIYPNPANDKVTLDFSLSSTKEVTIDVFDVVGKKVTQLVQQRLSEGNHKILWDVSQMHSGIYFMSCRIGEETYLRKVVVQ